jgi:hypothetical protein
VFSTEKDETRGLGIDDGFAKESVAEKGEEEEDAMVDKSVKRRDISSQYLQMKKVKENIFQLILALCKAALHFYFFLLLYFLYFLLSKKKKFLYFLCNFLIGM